MTATVGGSDEALDALWGAARAAAPEIDGARDAFVAHVEGLRRDGELPPLERAADLGLAFACARGHATAHRRLDVLLVETVTQAVRRIDASRAFADLVAQDPRARILVAPLRTSSSTPAAAPSRVGSAPPRRASR